MFKSVFSKYFAATAAIIFFSFLLLTGTHAFFASRYWLRNKQNVLADHAANISGFVVDNSVEVDPGKHFIPGTISSTLERLAESFDGNILVTDPHFRVIFCSHNSNCHHVGKTLPTSFQTALQNGPLFTMGKINDFYEEPQYCSGTVLTQKSSIIGYVVVTSSAKELIQYIVDNVQTSLFSGLAVIIVAFVILYLMTYRMVRPLRQMAIATRQFSQGDFSYRIKTRGKDEIAELATALNGMAVSLSSIDGIQRSFVENVSHELRTPMTTISGFIDGILDGTIPQDRHREYLTVVSDEVRRLSRLVQSMLDLSRIDTGALKPRPVSFDLTAMVCSTLILFEQRVEEKSIKVEGLDVCAPQMVIADYDLMQQVVYNLIDNAVKFTENGGYLRLAVLHKKDRTYCTIRNSGEGIPSNELPHIFERFYKSDRSRGLDKKGTGIGLYIVKTLLGLHGGEITVSSREQEYAEFTFWLPDAL